MSLDTAIQRFRARQVALFRDTGTVTRASGTPTFNEGTGAYSTPAPTNVYTGACQVRPAGGLVGTDVIVGEREVRLSDFVLKLPANTPVAIGDGFTVTASEYDADLIGREFRITDVLRDGRQIARVCVMEEAT